MAPRSAPSRWRTRRRPSCRRRASSLLPPPRRSWGSAPRPSGWMRWTPTGTAWPGRRRCRSSTSCCRTEPTRIRSTRCCLTAARGRPPTRARPRHMRPSPPIRWTSWSSLCWTWCDAREADTPPAPPRAHPPERSFVTHPRKALLAGALCAALAATASAAADDPQDVAAPAATALAPTAATLGLARAVAVAVDWHPRVRSAAVQVFEAGDYIDVARAGYLPQVRAGLSSEYGNHRLPGYDGRRAHRFVVSVSQMLYDFGKTSTAVDRAQAVRTAAQARLLLAVDEVARDTAQAWVEVRRHEDLQAIAREQKLGVTAIADLVRTRRRQGASPRSDEMQAQAREEAARAFELESAAQLERWRAQLRHL